MQQTLSPSPISEKAVSFLKRTQPLLIDGEWTLGSGSKTLAVFDPASGKQIAESADASADDVNKAVAAARRTFDTRVWLDIDPTERAKILWKIADIIDSRAADIIEIEVLNQGMPVYVAQWTLGMSANVFRYYAGWVSKIQGITTNLDTPARNFHAYTIREPMGVAALIVPWNGPFYFACAKLAVALAAGCSCVLKPSEETPLTAVMLGEILIEAGVPAGVVNIVQGLGDVAGETLVNHPDVDKIGFTGSTAVGKKIVRSSAETLKHLTLELGGKSPVIIFDDANMENALAGAAQGVFQGSGQMCVAGSRVYAHRKVYDEVVEGLSEHARNLKLGSGFDPSVHLGPLVSAKQLKHVSNLIESAEPQGAEIVTGGKRWGDEGFFVQPTVLANAPATSRVMREEIFGPVVAVTPFDDIDEVTGWANDTHYGLAAAIWTQNVTTAHTMARQMRAGQIWLNCQLASDLSIPSGGFKQSGLGKEHGLEGLDAYLQTKSVFLKL
jgi:phenylacetaldehyde dehydrogenase